jgi:hypothetical protein
VRRDLAATNKAIHVLVSTWGCWLCRLADRRSWIRIRRFVLDKPKQPTTLIDYSLSPWRQHHGSHTFVSRGISNGGNCMDCASRSNLTSFQIVGKIGTSRLVNNVFRTDRQRNAISCHMNPFYVLLRAELAEKSFSRAWKTLKESRVSQDRDQVS